MPLVRPKRKKRRRHFSESVSAESESMVALLEQDAESALESLRRQAEEERNARRRKEEPRQKEGRERKRQRRREEQHRTASEAQETPLAATSLGARLMQSMGFQHGQGLGKHKQGRAEALRVVLPPVSDDTLRRGGLGHTRAHYAPTSQQEQQESEQQQLEQQRLEIPTLPACADSGVSEDDFRQQQRRQFALKRLRRDVIALHRHLHGEEAEEDTERIKLMSHAELETKCRFDSAEFRKSSDVCFFCHTDSCQGGGTRQEHDDWNEQEDFAADFL